MVAKRDQGGFTLIELLIVIIILAILAAIVVFAVGSTNTNAIASSCNADAKSVETALEAYKAQIGTYPSEHRRRSTAGPTATTINGVDETVGPWLKELPSHEQLHHLRSTALEMFRRGPAGGSRRPIQQNGVHNPCNAC